MECWVIFSACRSSARSTALRPTLTRPCSDRGVCFATASSAGSTMRRLHASPRGWGGNCRWRVIIPWPRCLPVTVWKQRAARASDLHHEKKYENQENKRRQKARGKTETTAASRLTKIGKSRGRDKTCGMARSGGEKVAIGGQMQ